jgi:LEA14-like dessication related protein
MNRRHLIALGLAPAALAGCATLAPREPLQVSLVDVSGLPGEGLELRLAVRLRVQNPNETVLDYDGVSLQLDVAGRPLASGVSNARGSVPRFGEALITVPVTVPATSLLRQAWGFSRDTPSGGIEFTARGRLAGGLFGGASFSSTGRFDWPGAAASALPAAPR